MTIFCMLIEIICIHFGLCMAYWLRMPALQLFIYAHSAQPVLLSTSFNVTKTRRHHFVRCGLMQRMRFIKIDLSNFPSNLVGGHYPAKISKTPLAACVACSPFVRRRRWRRYPCDDRWPTQHVVHTHAHTHTKMVDAQMENTVDHKHSAAAVHVANIKKKTNKKLYSPRTTQKPIRSFLL